MKKDCDHCLEEILSADGAYPESVRRHIDQCRFCRSVASEWQAVRETVQRRDPPGELDFSIRHAATGRIKQHNRYKDFVHRCLYVTAAAACIMLLASIFLLSRKSTPDDPSALFGNNPGATKWISNIDKELLLLDTEIEVNRRLIAISQERELELEKILFPEPEVELFEYPVDEDYLL